VSHHDPRDELRTRVLSFVCNTDSLMKKQVKLRKKILAKVKRKEKRLERQDKQALKLFDLE
jgi:heme exporter protein D